MTFVVVVALAGWACALGLAIRHRNRSEELVRACHEIRGPLTAAQLALHASARRGELAPRRVAALELELRRVALALADLLGGGDSRANEIDVGELLRCQPQTWEDVARADRKSTRLNSSH